MTVMSRDNWAFGAQVITAVGILVIAILTFVNQANSEFRNEIRTELAAIRAEGRDINTRLARVEGNLRVPDSKVEWSDGGGGNPRIEISH